MSQNQQKDAIIDAIWEIRFDAGKEPEIVVGMVSELEFVKDFNQIRLSTADIPAAVRRADQNLKYQPIFVFKNENGPELVKVGGNVLSYHVSGQHNYIGGDAFKAQLRLVVDNLFSTFKFLKVTRLGYRFVNSLNEKDHRIVSINSLKLNINAGGANIKDDLSLSYFVTNNESSHGTLVRIATPYFVTGSKLPENTVAFIDIDVMTPDGYETSDADQVHDWIQTSHQYKNDAFYGLIPAELSSKLKEK